ncbi:MAG: FHA domain-containing protein [Bdellovibrionaceae bacterium]|nr:FHA domain-containing protein [Pseudobdellovibrionaceae bacterium]
MKKGGSCTLHITITGPDGSSRVDLSGGERWTMGRAPDCHFIVENANVSRKHLSIFEKDGGAWVEDHGSSNGTFIDGERLPANKPRSLKGSEEIKLGKSGFSIFVLIERAEEEIALPKSVPVPPKEESVTVPRALVREQSAVTPELPGEKAPSIPAVKPAEAAPPPPDEEHADTKIFARPQAKTAEAEKTLQQARIQAARTMQEAEVAAEKRAQEIVDRALNTQRKAEVFYKTHLQEAAREADSLYAKSREEGKALVQEARQQSQRIREETERSMQALRQRTEEECENLLRQMQEQARVAREERLKEADEIIRRQENELLASTRERLQAEEDGQKERLAVEKKTQEDRLASQLSAHEERLATEKGAQADKLARELKEHQERLAAAARSQEQRLAQELKSHQEHVARATGDLETALTRQKRDQEERLRQALEDHERQMQEARRAHEEKSVRELQAHQDRLAALKADLEKTIAARDAEKKTSEDLQARIAEQEIRYREMLANDAKEKSELSDVKETMIRLQREGDQQRAEIEALKNRAAEKNKELEQAGLRLSAVKEQLQQAEKEHEARQAQMKTRLAEEEESLRRAEEERLQQLQLETTRKVERFEKELLADLGKRRQLVEKEILLATELAVKNAGKDVDWSSLSPSLHAEISNILSGQPTTLKPGSAAKEARRQLFAGRGRERASWLVSGLAFGVLALWGAQTALMKVNEDKSPMTRLMASEREARIRDLEERKFNPPQDPEIKATYTDSVLSTSRFAEIYLDESFQREWFKAASAYLFKTWRLDEDRSLQALSAASALVRALAERKEKIHPDFVKEGIAKMQEQERETIERLREILGTQVRLESFKKFEAQFFTSHR